jgi:alkylation response protein AidB-like acyl-CoA dehydrogenase
MGPALRERRARARADVRVPDETVAEFAQAGFFKILQPEQWGGYAMDPQVFYAVGLEIARFCPSSAWILGVIAVHNWQLAVFDDRAAQNQIVLPISDYEIVHNWDVVGLQGTGSHDIVVDNAFVPEHRTHKAMDGFLCDNPGNVVNKAPLYRMPFMQVFVRAVCTATLGACEGALDAYIEVARTRQVGPNKMKNDPLARVIAAEVKRRSKK